MVIGIVLFYRIGNDHSTPLQDIGGVTCGWLFCAQPGAHIDGHGKAASQLLTSQCYHRII